MRGYDCKPWRWHRKEGNNQESSAQIKVASTPRKTGHQQSGQKTYKSEWINIRGTRTVYESNTPSMHKRRHLNSLSKCRRRGTNHYRADAKISPVICCILFCSITLFIPQRINISRNIFSNSATRFSIVSSLLYMTYVLWPRVLSISRYAFSSSAR